MAITPPQSPRLVIQPVPSQPRLTVTVRWLLCVILGASVGFYLGYKFGAGNEHNWQQRYQRLQANYQQEKTKWQQAQAQLSLLQTENRVQHETLQELQASLHEQAKTLHDRQKDLAFYQRLLSPAVSGKGLRVFEAEAHPVAENRWRLSLVLVQRIERARSTEGEMDVLLKGRKNGKEVTQPVTLMVNRDGDHKAFKRFKFKYFLPVTGILTVPLGLQPEEIIFRLKPKGKKAKMVESRFGWQDITSKSNHSLPADSAPASEAVSAGNSTKG